MKKKNSFIINILIILIVLSIVLYFSLKDDYDAIMNAILNMNFGWFLIAVILFCLYRTLVGISVYILTRINGENIHPFKGIQISFIIPFFHGVTPFAGGGQPMEVYYLHKENISVTKATNITVQNFIVYQISLVFMGFFALIYNKIFGIFPDNSLIKRLVILGVLINLLVLVVTFILSFGKIINKFILNQGINIIAKLRIIKDVDKTRNRLNEYLHNFHKNALKLQKYKLQVFINIIINISGIVFLYMIPYAIFKGLGIDNLKIIDAVVSTAYVMTIGSFVPIPGGTGGIEYGFMFFYGNLVKGSVLNAAMLVWRFVTYYMAMIIGAIFLSFYRKKEKNENRNFH
ncbi:MAG: flippase-like domain-containing protein [Bacilli bacterium]|nr:flippase-like domain-containing protein [Bacilli bacterium]